MPSTSMERLSAATLPRVRPGVKLPGYDRATLKSGIVHLGLGAFARGHLA
jgi:fructuronate reductase